MVENVIEFRKVRNDDGPKPKVEIEADVIDFRKATPATPVAPVAPTEDEPPLCLHCTVLNAIEAVVTSAVAAEVRPGEIFTSWGKGDWEKVVDPDQNLDAYSWRAGRMRYKPCKRSLEHFDAGLAGMLMRATKRWLSIPKQWQEPFLVWIARFA